MLEASMAMNERATLMRDERTSEVMQLIVSRQWGPLTLDELCSKWKLEPNTVLAIKSEALRHIRLAMFGDTLRDTRHTVMAVLGECANLALTRKKHWAWLTKDEEVKVHSEADPDVGGAIAACRALADITGIRAQTLRDARKAELEALSNEEIVAMRQKRGANGHAGKVH